MENRTPAARRGFLLATPSAAPASRAGRVHPCRPASIGRIFRPAPAYPLHVTATRGGVLWAPRRKAGVLAGDTVGSTGLASRQGSPLPTSEHRPYLPPRARVPASCYRNTGRCPVGTPPQGGGSCWRHRRQHRPYGQAGFTPADQRAQAVSSAPRPRTRFILPQHAAASCWHPAARRGVLLSSPATAPATRTRGVTPADQREALPYGRRPTGLRLALRDALCENQLRTKS